MKRRSLLHHAVLSCGLLMPWKSDAEATSLRAIAARKNVLFGSEVTLADIEADPAYANLIAQQCAVITPGIEAKWGYTEPNEGAFRLGPLDALASFATKNGLKLHMHNLIWAVGLPKWTIAAIAEGRESAIMARHIATLVCRYQDQVESWDVINEPVDPRWPSGPEGLCRTPWRNGLGPGYIDQALRDAAAINPRLRLLINDDDLEYDATDREQKRMIYLRLIDQLRRHDVPIHGFGLEAHLKPWLTLAEPAYRRFLAGLADLGLSLYVTELDVCDRYLPADTGLRDQAVADFAKRYLDIVLDNPATRSVTTWGLSDRSTWMVRDLAGRRADGAAPRPLPYDTLLAAKPMRDALVSAFMHARARPA